MLSACATPGTHVTETARLQARAAYERGLKAMEDRAPSAALVAFQEAIALDDSMPAYRNALGLLYFYHLQQYEAALEQFARALEIDPDHADAYLNLGTVLAEMRRWDAAVEAYRKALSFPTFAHPESAYHGLGVALYNLRRYQEAEESLRLALALEPQMGPPGLPYYNLGLVFMAENRKDDAKIAFRRAVELAPDSAYGQAAREKLRSLGEGG